MKQALQSDVIWVLTKGYETSRMNECLRGHMPYAALAELADAHV